ncbi:aldolase [Nisaea acidiphila]|uniref:Aldolase n=1 Tax=Nisaea acidiphila TaxID=1862145 RepID=A0A9J7AVD2_9PROT|nr:aldolase [Nisaea acidiphila]UUX51295.1 aldolase [Nisaea acidiphila]
MNTDIRQARIDLACSLRWAARYGLNEGVDNHFSLALPDDDGVMRGNRFLINPFGWHWSEVTASSMVLCDGDGNILEGDETVEDTAFFIHSEMHKAVPSAVCIMHTHQPYATALTLLEDGRLEMCEQNALMFDGRIAYDDEYGGLALDENEGARMASKIGNKSVLFLACHGVITTGPTVQDTFNDLYYLERAAKFQVLAKSTGRKLRSIPEETRAHTRQQASTENARVADRHFKALRRMLEKEEPEFLN